MDAKAQPLKANAKENSAYARARVLLNEKRELLRRLNELNRELRDLNNEDAEAVTTAILESPLRNRRGRPRQIHTSAK